MGQIADAVPSDERVRGLIEAFSGDAISLGHVLCDGHDPAAIAYRIISPDLGAEVLTYGDLRSRSERFAAALAGLGVARGDRVATLMGKSAEFLVTLTAIWRLGAVHVPLFTAFAAASVELRLASARAKVVVVDPDQRTKVGASSGSAAQARVVTTGAPDGEAAAFGDLMAAAGPFKPAARLGGASPMIHIFTSGTTGPAKAVVVPVRALAAFQAYAEFGLDLRAGEDLYWCAADPGWAYGLYFGVLATFLTGTPGLLLRGGFSPELTFAILERFAVTNFAAAPTVYRSLRGSGVPAPSALALRSASSAGEPLTGDINDWARAALGVEIFDHYGQTETGMVINNHHAPALRAPLKAGSMGRPMPGWRAAVLDEREAIPAPAGTVGRVALDLSASPLAWFGGYLDDAARSAEKFSDDGRWYVTGDLGRVDDDGDFFFASRDDDIILMAGYRIGPAEVEEVILAHPAIAECAVVAAPDPVRGEVLECFVVPAPGHAPSAALAGEIQGWVKARYAAHAYPRTVHFAEALPRTPSGKLQRFALRRRLADRA